LSSVLTSAGFLGCAEVEERGKHNLRVKRTAKYKDQQTALGEGNCCQVPWAVGQEVTG